jgi:hypothetical protein
MRAWFCRTQLTSETPGKREAYCLDEVAKDGEILVARQKMATTVDARIVMLMVASTTMNGRRELKPVDSSRGHQLLILAVPPPAIHINKTSVGEQRL